MTTPLQIQGDDQHENRHMIVRADRRPLNVRYAMPEQAAPQVQDTDDLVFVMQYLRILWKHKWVLVLSLVLGALLGIGVSLWMVPLYESAATMEIQNVQEPFSSALIGSQADPALMTQSQLLSSRAMKQRALAKLNAKAAPQLPEVLEPLASLRRFLGLAEPLKTLAWTDATGIASGSLSVSIGRDSRILNISSSSPNPQAAADFVNTLAKEYIEKNQEDRWESYQNTNAWLTKAQAELKDKVEQTERKAADFARAKKLTFIAKTDNISEERLRQLQGALSAASTDRITKQSVYDSSLSSPTESLPAVLDSGPMGGYQAKIADLKREMAQLSATLTPAHYRVQQVQAQINELEIARDKERTNILSRIRIDYEAAVKRENQLKRDFEAQAGVLDGQADDIIQYNILLREVESNKKLYESTLQQGKEASLASIMRTSSARVVDQARPGRVPYAPNIRLNLTLSMLGALMCGIVYVVVRSRSDLRIQVPGVLGTHLNLRELGIIPSAKTDPAIRTVLRSIGSAGSKSDRRTMLAGASRGSSDCLELVTWNRKPSVMAEAFRSTMTSIMFSGENGDRPGVLLFTSPSPREGKSTIVCNLAIALAEINHRVLVIDADMRLPRLHRIFDVSNTFGLSDILHERTAIQDYVDESLIRKTTIANLSVLPAGPARANLSRLLYSNRMIELIKRFRPLFDAILIDSPPVLSVPDARILARAADAVVLVVRAHQTQQEAAFAAVRCFEEDGRRILGTVLNDWNPSTSPYGPYSFYGGYNPYDSHNSPYFKEDKS